MGLCNSQIEQSDHDNVIVPGSVKSSESVPVYEYNDMYTPDQSLNEKYWLNEGVSVSGDFYHRSQPQPPPNSVAGDDDAGDGSVYSMTSYSSTQSAREQSGHHKESCANGSSTYVSHWCRHANSDTGTTRTSTGSTTYNQLKQTDIQKRLELALKELVLHRQFPERYSGDARIKVLNNTVKLLKMEVQEIRKIIENLNQELRRNKTVVENYDDWKADKDAKNAQIDDQKEQISFLQKQIRSIQRGISRHYARHASDSVLEEDKATKQRVCDRGVEDELSDRFAQESVYQDSKNNREKSWYYEKNCPSTTEEGSPTGSTDATAQWRPA